MLFTTHKLHGDTKGKDGQQRVHNNNMNNNNISQKAARKTIKKLLLFFRRAHRKAFVDGHGHWCWRGGL